MLPTDKRRPAALACMLLAAGGERWVANSGCQQRPESSRTHQPAGRVLAIAAGGSATMAKLSHAGHCWWDSSKLCSSSGASSNRQQQQAAALPNGSRQPYRKPTITSGSPGGGEVHNHRLAGVGRQLLIPLRLAVHHDDLRAKKCTTQRFGRRAPRSERWHSRRQRRGPLPRGRRSCAVMKAVPAGLRELPAGGPGQATGPLEQRFNRSKGLTAP